MSALRRREEAIKYGREAVRLTPRSRNAHNGLGMSYANRGVYPEALDEFEVALKLAGTPAATVAVMGQIGRVHALAGNRAQTLEILRQLQQRESTAAVWNTEALVYLGLREKNRAMDALVRADSAGANFGLTLLGPMFDLVRDDARFKAILAKEERGDS